MELFFRRFYFIFLIAFLLFFLGCDFSSPPLTYQLDQSLKNCWKKEKLLLGEIGKNQDKKSLTRLQRETVNIKKELDKTRALLKKILAEESLSKMEIGKKEECLSLLSETAEEINSFLIFELSSEEEINTLSEVSWRLTSLSGKLARVFNLISQSQLEEARKEVEKIKAELFSCRQLIGQVKQKLLISFDEVNSYFGKLEILIKTAESFLKNQGMGEEEKEKVKEQMKEFFSTSLEALSLSERNRAELIQQAELKLQKAARILGVK